MDAVRGTVTHACRLVLGLLIGCSGCLSEELGLRRC